MKDYEITLLRAKRPAHRTQPKKVVVLQEYSTPHTKQAGIYLKL